jgi:hypothetical protein
MEPVFDKVYSIEFDERLHYNAKMRYSTNKLKFLLGDSSIVLPELLPTINDNVIFFLDGHWSLGITGRGAKDCPLVEEITHINNLFRNKAIIIIDDFRLFGTAPSDGICTVDWVNINKDDLLAIVKGRTDQVYHLPSELANDDRLIIHLNKS